MTHTTDHARELGTKAATALEFVDDEKGEITAIVYTLGVVDNEGEVILPDAFQDGMKVKLSDYGHSTILAQMRGAPTPVRAPVGKGVLTKVGNSVVFRGRYFMSTQRGREAHATAKEMGPEQEWSFSYWKDKGEAPSAEWAAKGARRVYRFIEPFEVSPVTIPGGIGTQTLGVKCQGCGTEHDGQACEPCATKAAKLAAKEQEAKVEADAKAAADAEAARIAEETRQAAERAEAAIKQAAAEEFERFQRTSRRIGG